MKLTWSQQLFFFLNKKHGQRIWFDQFMVFAAQYLIVLHIAIIILATFFILADQQWILFELFAKETMFLVAVALVTSYTIGWVVPHRRPIREFPQTSLLFHTLKTWKSFPSDHTIMVFSTWGMFLWFSLLWLDDLARVRYSILIFLIVTFVSAALVAFSRIYCGVHYPRDILGGILIAAFYVWLFESSVHWWNILYVNGWAIALVLAVVLVFGYHRRIIRFISSRLS